MLNILNELSNLKGGDKLPFLKLHPELKEILRHTYDPFKKYYINSPEVEGIEDGLEIGPEHFVLLYKLNSRSLSGHRAYQAVSGALACLTYDDAIIFKGMVNKDLKLGLGATSINKVWPGLIPVTHNGTDKVAVMLLKNFDDAKAKYPLLMSFKKDGVRNRVVNEEFYTRTGQKITGLSHILKEIEGFKFELDGEICIPNKGFDESSGLVRNDSEVPDAVYHVFDAPTAPGGTKLRNDQLIEWFKDGTLGSAHVKLIPKVVAWSRAEVNLYYKMALDADEEGIVTYNPNAPYEDKRGYDWMRMVPLKTADCKCVGFYEGEGNFDFTLGGIIVEYKGRQCKVGTGFKLKQWDELTDRELTKLEKEGFDKETYSLYVRDNIWEKQDFYLGKIVKCVFKEETKKGSMRQPRFKGWRLDKTEPNFE